ncbi:MAG: Protein TolB [Pelotomaculum sp. PtaB.Bin104]|nr:MAG: Protein TolB [Pelotomaculum sp. PtaB.Bin104]
MPVSIALTHLAAAITISLLLFSVVLSPVSVAASEGENLSVRVQVNSHEVDFPDARPFIDTNGRTQAPARFVAQALGAEVSWNEGVATFRGNGKEIVLTAGKSTAAVNGAYVVLDSGALLIEDRIYAPVRFIAETLGAVVLWDADSRLVKITMDKPIINGYGITYTKIDAGWYIVPRTFTAWVESNNAQKVDFYLTPTGTGQEPVKIATSFGSEGYFSITYRLPQTSIMGHLWAVAVNNQGEQSTDILNVYREADGSEQDSIEFGNLFINVFNQDLKFAPGGGRAVFSGYSYSDVENKGNHSRLLMLDTGGGTVKTLDEGEFIRNLGWDSAGENVLYMKDGSLCRLSVKDGGKSIIADNTFYGTFSPDGRRIAFAQSNNGLWVCDLSGDNKKRLTKTNQDWYPVWYPDGQHLFYFNDLEQELGDGAGHLQGMAKLSVADGSIETILPQMTGKFRSAEWLVPGRSLHVISGWDDGFYQHIVDLTEGNINDLGENFGISNYVTAVNTAAGLFFKASPDEIKIYDGSGNLKKSIDYSFDRWVFLSAAFTPDGRIIMMMGKMWDEGQDQLMREIVVLDPESEIYDVIAEGGENFEACFWEPGMGQILILEKSAADKFYQLTNFSILPATLGRY